MPIKIIIADDHPAYRYGVSKIIEHVKEFKIIGEAHNGEELIRLANDLKPDVILTDINMPDIDGIQATKQLTASIPGIKVVALTMAGESNIITDMIESGVKGYIQKTATAEEIVAAIKAVFKGETYYCENTTAHLINSLSGKTYGARKVYPHFSQREISIIKLLCNGYSHKEIACQVYLSVRTIEWYKKQILDKIDSKNTSAIVAYAIKNKIC